MESTFIFLTNDVTDFLTCQKSYFLPDIFEIHLGTWLQ